jgi:hypothetical protein
VEHKLDPFNRKERGLPDAGILDATASFVSAGKSCLWACISAVKSG